MKKHVLLCNLAGELNIGSLRRLSALHSTFFSLWKTLVLVVVVVVAVVCTLHVVVFPSFFHLIILSLLTAYKGREEKQQKGNLNIRQSFNPTTCADIFILLDCMYYYHGVILLGVNNVWRLRLLDF